MFAKFVSATWGEETGAEAEDEVSIVYSIACLGFHACFLHIRHEGVLQGQAKEAPEQQLGETKCVGQWLRSRKSTICIGTAD